MSPAVISGPEFHVPDSRDGEEGRGGGHSRDAIASAERPVVVKRIEEHVSLVVDETPKRLRVLPDPILLPLLVAVVEEGAKQTRVEVVEDEREKVFVKLERVWKLVSHLPDAIYEL